MDDGDDDLAVLLGALDWPEGRLRQQLEALEAARADAAGAEAGDVPPGVVEDAR